MRDRRYLPIFYFLCHFFFFFDEIQRQLWFLGNILIQINLANDLLQETTMNGLKLSICLRNENILNFKTMNFFNQRNSKSLA